MDIKNYYYVTKGYIKLYVEGNHINCNCCRNQKQVKMRSPFDPKNFMEYKNSKINREKAWERKHCDLIDLKESKKASEDVWEVKSERNPMKQKSLLSMFY